MADVWLAPYFPLSADMVVGPWRFVPFRDFARRHACSQGHFNEVRRLRTAYRLRQTSMPFGAIVIPAGGRVGDQQPREPLRPLSRAMAAAVIDGNPSFLTSQDEPNAGHAMASAENAQLFGHPLHGGHSYAISTGAMVQQQRLSHAPPGRPLPRIAPPHDLPTPLFSRFDEEYAAAVYEALLADVLTARRLDRSIEWLAIAWSNTTALSEDARVLVFRTGLEALLGGGADTRRNRALLSELLDEPDAPRTPRTWPRGPKQPVPLTEMEWWFVCFAHLRNAVAHGDVIAREDWLHEDGNRHVWHADDVLRRAVKRTVVRALDEPDLELDRFRRHLRRAWEKHLSEDHSA
jgi:hypothetical protein